MQMVYTLHHNSMTQVLDLVPRWGFQHLLPTPSIHLSIAPDSPSHDPRLPSTHPPTMQGSGITSESAVKEIIPSFMYQHMRRCNFMVVVSRGWIRIKYWISMFNPRYTPII